MRILVADDDLTSRKLMSSLVRKAGYEAVEAANGAEAWSALNKEGYPRIALLDWMMPGIDGIEICRRMSRERQGEPLVYLVVVTASEDRSKLVEALENGAHDFQFKPVNYEELRCRLAVGQRLVEADDQLQAYARNLERLAEERAQQLVHADRLATLGTLTAGIAHEINNPVAFISGNVQTQELMWEEMSLCLQHCLENGVGNARKIGFILEEHPNTLKGIRQGVSRVSTIVQGLKSYARQRSEGKVDNLDVSKSIENALLLTHNVTKNSTALEKDVEEGLPPVRGDAQQIEQIFVNFIVNAVDAMAGQPEKVLRIGAKRRGSMIHVSFADNGPGIPEAYLTRIFDPFFTTKPVGKGTGLGLSICKGIVESHGGTITARNAPEGGAVFLVEFPCEEEKNAETTHAHRG